MNHLKRSSGFTLIELIIVIVILGILTVVAAPRFIEVSSDAHSSVFQTTFKNFKSGMNLVHTKWLVKGSPSPANATDLIGDLDYTDIGYPSGTDDGTEVETTQDCLDIFYAVTDTSLVLQTASGRSEFSQMPSEVDIGVTRGSGRCYYTYIAESKSVGTQVPMFQYNYVSGEISIWDTLITL